LRNYLYGNALFDPYGKIKLGKCNSNAFLDICIV